VNCFDGRRRNPLESITRALNLTGDVPVIACDARSRESSRDVLVALAEHAIARHAARRAA
jgi:signal recognition particle receptor subunit beta